MTLGMISTTEVLPGDLVSCYAPGGSMRVETVRVESTRRVRSIRRGEPDRIRVSIDGGLSREWNAAGSVYLLERA